MKFVEALKKAANMHHLALTEVQIRSFDQYYQLLIKWNEKINLTAITDPEQVAVKHMIDSLSCFDTEIVSAKAKVIDVGTGAGFPGLPLKIWQDGITLTMLDSLNKRVKFLNCVTETLGLSGVESIHGRAEEYARIPLYRDAYDVAVSRAVARLNVLCELCLPFVRQGGYFIALKGAQYQSEIEEAEKVIALLGGRVKKVAPVKLPGIEDIRAVIYIEKIKKTPSIYPRRTGIPEKVPL